MNEPPLPSFDFLNVPELELAFTGGELLPDWAVGDSTEIPLPRDSAPAELIRKQQNVIAENDEESLEGSIEIEAAQTRLALIEAFHREHEVLVTDGFTFSHAIGAQAEVMRDAIRRGEEPHEEVGENFLSFIDEILAAYRNFYWRFGN